jgi:hypothetical protein
VVLAVEWAIWYAMLVVPWVVPSDVVWAKMRVIWFRSCDDHRRFHLQYWNPIGDDCHRRNCSHNTLRKVSPYSWYSRLSTNRGDTRLPNLGVCQLCWARLRWSYQWMSPPQEEAAMDIQERFVLQFATIH